MRRPIIDTIVRRPAWEVLLPALLAAIASAACDECKTSADCDLGEVCIDGACESGSVDGDTDGDTDADGDADTDTDGDTDTDADGDTDSDSDTDADADSDTDSDTDGDCVNPLTDCPDDGDPCTGAACEEGACAVVPLSDVPCDEDADECIGGTCDEGVCLAEPLSGSSCTFDDNDCTLDVCDDGVCTALPLNAVACDYDDTACTEDVCLAGECTGIANQVGEPCESDSNSCTNDVCGSGGTCTHTDFGYGYDCQDDGSDCTADYCDGEGTCLHDPLAWGFACADEGNDCTSDYCDGDGTCLHPNLGSSVACGPDGNPCTNDFCDGEGSCGLPISGIACDDDDNECTNDTCVVGVCNHLGLTGQSCTPDGNDCTQDLCNAGTCGLALNGSPCAYDDNECTGDVCDGAVCTGPEKPDGTSCEDGSWCDGQEECQDGNCSADLQTVPCLLADLCREGECTEPVAPETVGSCEVELLDGVDCADELECNGREECVVGACVPVEPPCPDSTPDVCQQVVCEEGLSEPCSLVDHEDETPCPDELLCNGLEICLGGSCESGQPFCASGSDCMWQECEEGELFVSCGDPVFADDGTPCEVDNSCAGEGVHLCVEGQCGYGEDPACLPEDGDNDFCTWIGLCIDEGDDPACSYAVSGTYPGRAAILACDPQSEEEATAWEVNTATVANDVSDYGTDCPGDYDGGDAIYVTRLASGAAFTVTLTTDASTTGDDLNLLVVSDPCAPETGDCALAAGGTYSGNAPANGKVFLAVDGMDGTRGVGEIEITCP
jgi:hypothetical protein